MLRCVALGLTLCLPALGWAFGLGEISVNSALNEPLDARIELHSLRPGELDELQVGLADDAAFRALGLEKTGFLRDVNAELLPGASEERGVILLTSRQAAREPFLSLVLEVEGLESRVLREYTVLLDPATVSRDAEEEVVEEPEVAVSDQAEVPAPTARPVTTPQPAPAATPRPVPATQPRPASPGEPVRGDNERRVPVPQPEVYQPGEQPQPVLRDVTPVPKPTPGPVVADEPAAPGSQYGPVKRGETLWSIAKQLRPDQRVTMDQVLWALYSVNPEKFDGNLNLVKRGAVLEVPSRQVMINVSPAEAAALVAEETAEHRARAGRAPAPAPAAETVETVEVEPAPTPAPTAAPTPAPTPARAAREPGREAPAELPALPVEEEPEAAEAELPALPAEPEAPEEPAQPREPEERAEVVDTPAMPEADVDEEAAALERLRELAGDYGEDEAADTDAAPAAEDEAAALPALPSEPEEDAQPTPTAAPSESEGGFNPLWLIGLLIVLGAGGALLWLRRRQAPAEEPSAAAAPRPAAEAAPAAAATWAGEPAPEPVETTAEQPAYSDTDVDETSAFAATDVDQSSAFGETTRMDRSAAGEQHTEVFETPQEAGPPAEEDLGDLGGSEDTLDLGSDTVSIELNEDPVSEADFHLAYGLYDEAALLLNQAIESDPDRLELREKLAETHFAAGNAEEFQATAQALKDKNPDDATWQKVVIMGQQLCPDADLFQGEVAGEAVDFGLDEGGEGGLDMDFGGEEEEARGETPAEEPGAAGAPDLDEALEFDLGEDTSAESPAPEPSSQQAGAEDDNLLEFEPSVKEPEAADKPADEAASSEADFDLDTDFGDFDLEAEAGAGEEELPDLDDELDFGDLEAELGETAGEVSDPTAEKAPETVDWPEWDEGPAEEPTEDLQAPTESLAEAPPEQSGEPAEAEVTGLATDFDLDEVMEDTTEADSASDRVDSGDDDEDPLAALDVDDLQLERLDDAGTDEERASEAGVDTTLTDQNQAELTAELPDEALDDLDLGVDDADSIGDGDEAGTKLDLARAYVDMGEADMARGLLKEVAASGDEDQKSEARSLLDRLG